MVDSALCRMVFQRIVRALVFGILLGSSAAHADNMQ